MAKVETTLRLNIAVGGVMYANKIVFDKRK
jgi:hypothetical protein